MANFSGKRIVIAGGSGFLGLSMSEHFSNAGAAVAILSRSKPKRMVRLGAPLVFRTDPELVLYGRYVVSKRLAEEGFRFQFPDLESALKDLHDKNHG